jgi:cell division protein FtsZ
MGIGSARGDDRAVAAAESAVSSPLLEASIDGAHGVLLSIAGGSDLGLFEINEAAALVAQAAHAEANIIFGAVIDDALGDEVRVTVIAAGFDGGMPKRRDHAQPGLRRGHPAPGAGGQPAPHPQQVAQQMPPQQPGRPMVPVGAGVPAGAGMPMGAAGQAAPAPGPRPDGPPPGPPQGQRAPRPVAFDNDDDGLDVPDFLK